MKSTQIIALLPGGMDAPTTRKADVTRTEAVDGTAKAFAAHVREPKTQNTGPNAAMSLRLDLPPGKPNGPKLALPDSERALPEHSTAQVADETQVTDMRGNADFKIVTGQALEESPQIQTVGPPADRLSVAVGQKNTKVMSSQPKAQDAHKTGEVAARTAEVPRAGAEHLWLAKLVPETRSEPTQPRETTIRVEAAAQTDRALPDGDERQAVAGPPAFEPSLPDPAGLTTQDKAALSGQLTTQEGQAVDTPAASVRNAKSDTIPMDQNSALAARVTTPQISASKIEFPTRLAEAQLVAPGLASVDAAPPTPTGTTGAGQAIPRVEIGQSVPIPLTAVPESAQSETRQATGPALVAQPAVQPAAGAPLSAPIPAPNPVPDRAMVAKVPDAPVADPGTRDKLPAEDSRPLPVPNRMAPVAQLAQSTSPTGLPQNALLSPQAVAPPPDVLARPNGPLDLAGMPSPPVALPISAAQNWPIATSNSASVPTALGAVISRVPGVIQDMSLTGDRQPSDGSPWAEPSQLQSGGDKPAIGREVTFNPSRLIGAIADAARSLTVEKQLEIRLNPEELGRVRLGLQATDQGLSVIVNVERPDTLDLLRRNIDLLAQQLKDVGYDEMTFRFSQEWASGGNAQDGDENGANAQGSDQDLPPSDLRLSAPKTTLAVSMDGRLDIKL